MTTPRLHVDLKKIHHNTRWLVKQLGARGITVTGVTKAFLGSPEIAKTLRRSGLKSIGDSRIENIKRMCNANIRATFILLRTPQLSDVKQVVRYSDISLNTELNVIRKLSQAAEDQKKKHRILLMVELGDLREGILPEDLEDVVRQSLALPGIQIAGIGTNLACLGGVKPNSQKMKQLSNLVESLEAQFNFTFEIVSGGNSANLEWCFNSVNTGRINNLRLGESIFLGRETLNRSPVEGLYTDAITLVTEVIESKLKPAIPSGELCQNAFGEKTEFHNRGSINHAILGIGRQDVRVSGLTPLSKEIEIFGSSSDHLIVISNKQPLHVGDEVRFSLNYGALLAAMTSPYVEKIYSRKMIT